MILEACVGSVDDAILAQQNGAHQLELCDRLDLDGTTPPVELVAAVVAAVDVPVKVILNPVPFKYRYSLDQLDEIIVAQRQLESLGVAGFVFGALNEDGLPDLDAVKRIAAATSLPLTFHKAIDEASDNDLALEMLIAANDVGFVLTSGGEANAQAGQSRLLRMRDVLVASESPIELIAAGSITAENLPALHQTLGLNYYHGKRVV